MEVTYFSLESYIQFKVFKGSLLPEVTMFLFLLHVACQSSTYSHKWKTVAIHNENYIFVLVLVLEFCRVHISVWSFPTVYFTSFSLSSFCLYYWVNGIDWAIVFWLIQVFLEQITFDSVDARPYWVLISEHSELIYIEKCTCNYWSSGKYWILCWPNIGFSRWF